MREPLVSNTELEGMLLIAHPDLRDPNFARSVSYLVSSNAEEGSFGLIMNRPTGQTVGDIVTEQSVLGGLEAVPVYLGGPVSADQLLFAAFSWDSARRKLECVHHAGPAKMEELIHQPNTVVRAFIGYAGWSKGQLEREMTHGGWLLANPVEGLLQDAPTEDLWKELVSGFGPRYRIIAEAPDDPTLN